MRQLRQLMEENARLKRLVVDLILDKQILQEVIKRDLRSTRRREIAHWIHDRFQGSAKRSCALAKITRATWYCRSRAQDRSAIRMRIRELAHARLRFGYERITVMLRREC